MLLAQAQEACVILHEDQQDILADRLEEMDDDYDVEASAIFMASLSPIGSINVDTIGPTYDSNMISEVPHYDNYHETDVLNFDVQETEYT
uniref:Integrase, catalytic region, zinc finger, CCHC-type, peptidase aspartic, catalytic n=1 Tax=Tanacetum cinerariifolium TaxID=118510 RepID=A0A6L2N236_TANCI|nr:hypothetical protein [Tanacetum cinerariifolium]